MLLKKYLANQLGDVILKASSSYRGGGDEGEDSPKKSGKIKLEQYVNSLDGKTFDLDKGKYAKTSESIDEQIKKQKKTRILILKLLAVSLVLAFLVTMPLTSVPPGGESVLQSLYPDPTASSGATEATSASAAKIATTVAAPASSMIAYNFVALAAATPILGFFVSLGLLLNSKSKMDRLKNLRDIRDHLKPRINEDGIDPKNFKNILEEGIEELKKNRELESQANNIPSTSIAGSMAKALEKVTPKCLGG
ncbi:MAG: hypothetical protein ACKO47_03290 [Alphaproteobacteria bacterium]